ncbi:MULTISPECIES: hypothetical protein [Virgibacillus]|jgi:hypothetical protein|uniref:Uncharacterized protein n=1 Tax=Virgibacillus halodenitrificans TaxID=1482 RepID=A0AAC9J387_VIRHA|nr:MULTISPECIES: hypothetical protein [Virgibacillus]AIF45608.1 hypothetical protein X953_17440 [Virgibacillus sp. SK37]APC49773.1 hypothetical protein BME96_16940 [Virgibacillus halodenitrificans]MBD1221504.1 hypothetical protein [Virgibacillus halodenitrificans]MCG1028243.1 hypothetical protein [Virgibacillus halodenitrificans]MCJ0932853.1 hypothetical protein [Virgibacillus halodenitrificans]
MSNLSVQTLKQGQNYTARELDNFVSTKDVVVLSNNENQLFTDPEREYKVVHEFEGFFEHSMEDAEKHFRNKKAYVVEKV